MFSKSQEIAGSWFKEYLYKSLNVSIHITYFEIVYEIKINEQKEYFTS